MPISNAVNGPESAPYLAKSGGTMTGPINMGSQLISALATPVSGTDAANKTYVDNLVQNVHVACLAGSTANLTATYDNGTSGVGATLTNAGAFAVFSIDGVSPSVGQRVLIKNQSSQLENGVYTVTTVGDAVSVNWVLTRATDYDESSDMQAGDKFAVVSGTTQAATEWMMTQTAAITVGVTAITFAEMGQVTSAITAVVTQVFTSNGTYTPTSGMSYCIIECVGGGGGGGAGTYAAANNQGAGAGGGGGGYAKLTATASTIGASQAITIGAAGTAGTAGGNGGNGGNTTVGALLTGNGGNGGTAGANSAPPNMTFPGGNGGTGASGDVNIRGGDGESAGVYGNGSLYLGGGGGSSMFSPSNLSRTYNTGSTVIGYGGGGQGGRPGDGVAADARPGTAGIVIVTEFISTSA